MCAGLRDSHFAESHRSVARCSAGRSGGSLTAMTSLHPCAPLPCASRWPASASCRWRSREPRRPRRGACGSCWRRRRSPLPPPQPVRPVVWPRLAAGQARAWPSASSQVAFRRSTSLFQPRDNRSRPQHRFRVGGRGSFLMQHSVSVGERRQRQPPSRTASAWPRPRRQGSCLSASASSATVESTTGSARPRRASRSSRQTGFSDQVVGQPPSPAGAGDEGAHAGRRDDPGPSGFVADQVGTRAPSRPRRGLQADRLGPQVARLEPRRSLRLASFSEPQSASAGSPGQCFPRSLLHTLSVRRTTLCCHAAASMTAASFRLHDPPGAR